MPLASLVQPQEAALFEELAGIVAHSLHADVLENQALMEAIQLAIAEAIGGTVILQVRGSTMKGTHTRSSDIDIVVDTPGRCVSRSDKEAVVESLKRCTKFHASHVKLKTLAIQCVPVGVQQEIDLIFSNTLEFGQLPSSHDRFADNPAAQHAARLLKISVKDTLSGRALQKVPGFLLELLILEVQELQSTDEQQLADGSMQLYIAALQALVDDRSALGEQRIKSQLALSLMERNYEPGLYQYPAPESEKESSVPGPSGPVGWNARVLLRKHAGSILASFTASRMYTPNQEGFTNIVFVELLVRNMSSHFTVKTPLGEVPGWIFGSVHPDQCFFGLHCMGNSTRSTCGMPESMRSRSLSHCEEILQRNIRLVELFRKGSYGRYTNAGQAESLNWAEWIEKNNAVGTIDLRELCSYADAGSVVAERMCHARMRWLDGERALKAGQYPLAIKLISDSLRLSIWDGDPFSGSWAQGPDGLAPEYNRAIQSVLDSGAPSIEARVVQGRMLLEMGNPAAGERVLSSAISDAPDKVHTYAMRYMIRGNAGNWKGLLNDAQRCIELDPSQPIHYFWSSVARRHLPEHFDYKCFAADVHRFIEMASPEGRKVCQAWWDLALITSTRHAHGRAQASVTPRYEDVNADLVIRYAKEGFESEKLMLSVLLKNETRSPSQARDFCRAIIASNDPVARHTLGAEIAMKVRARANEAFKSSHYAQAIDLYTKVLDVPQFIAERYVVLSNRSAALAKLDDFVAAEQDALECIKLEPKWAKGYVRLARARIGRAHVIRSSWRAKGALAAISQAVLLGMDRSQLVALEKEVQMLLSLLAKPLRPSCDPTALLCWEEALYKDSVVVVDHQGTGDYADLCTAVLRCSVSKPTTIIMRSGSYCQTRPCSMQGLCLQIIGDGEVTLTGALHNSDDQVLIRAVAPTTNLTLQNLKLSLHTQGQCPAHVVFASLGASVTIKRCSLASSAAAVVGDHRGLLYMEDCVVPKGASAGILVADDAKAVVRNCIFTDNLKMAAEARTGACFELLRCTITGCQRQAAVCWHGGGSMKLEDCAISDCGQILHASGVYLCCGDATLLRCRIFENRGDGVVVEARDNGQGSTFASLHMASCIIRANAQNGVALYGGNASLEENKIQENVQLGIKMHPHMGNPLVQVGTGSFVRNALHGNGAESFEIYISGCDEKVMKRVTFDGNTCASSGNMAFVEGRDSAKFAEARMSRQSTQSEEKSEVLAKCAVKKSYIIDVSTGLKLSKGANPLSRYVARSATAVRTQAKLPSEADILAVHFDKQTLVESQERDVRHFEAAFRDALRDGEMRVATDSGVLPEEAKRPSRKTASELSECTIADLAKCPNRRSVGRMLYGTLCTNPTRVTSVMSVLEDEYGYAVRIAFYNVTCARNEHGWRDRFPIGLRIALKEPFLKRYAMDAGVGIRVDHPSDLIFITAVCSWAGCGVAETKQRQLKRCSRCKLVSYCSKDHQLMDWRAGHKEQCIDCGAAWASK